MDEVEQSDISEVREEHMRSSEERGGSEIKRKGRTGVQLPDEGRELAMTEEARKHCGREQNPRCIRVSVSRLDRRERLKE